MTAAGSSIVIRDIETTAEFKAIEEFQREIWGIPDIDVVPLYHLVASVASGGILLGAYDRTEIVGFVYGFVGFERGRTVHHSHMLAVHPEYRSQDLGFRLKAAQRERVLSQGISIMTWTFDPLQSLKANFNIRKLGAVADRYYIDFYGSDAASFLHSTGTDRLWVSWMLRSERVISRIEKSLAIDDRQPPRPLVDQDPGEVPILNDLSGLAAEDEVSIKIPRSINSIAERDRGLAMEWRFATRDAFVAAFDAGFAVSDFVIAGPSDHVPGGYILRRDVDLSYWQNS